MSDSKIILTTEAELSNILARQLEKYLTAKQTRTERVVQIEKHGNYNSKDVQEIFCISTTTVWRWENKGWLKPISVERGKVYLRNDIHELMEKKRVRRA